MATTANAVANQHITRPIKVAAERDITAGELSANDAYDLELWKLPNGDFELVVFMKIQFFFAAGPGGEWAAAERQKYISDWKTGVTTAWSGRNFKVLKNGRRVHMRLTFAVQEGGWMLDHWEITVKKIKPGTFQGSYVNTATGNVVLDSEDLTPVSKGGKNMQRGAVHEFGHMLGLDDEYLKGSRQTSDPSSVMHSGGAIRDRHVQGPRQWLNAKLKGLGLE